MKPASRTDDRDEHVICKQIGVTLTKSVQVHMVYKEDSGVLITTGGKEAKDGVRGRGGRSIYAHGLINIWKVSLRICEK